MKDLAQRTVFAKAAILVLATGGLAFGQAAPGAAPPPYDTPTQAPAYPSSSNVPPANGAGAPYAPPAAAAPQGPETVVVGQPTPVLVLPFTPLNDDATNHYGWVSQAVDESVKSNLARNPALQFQGGTAVAYDARSGNSMRDGALAEARQKNAAIVVFGTYQIVSDQLRVTGEVVNAASGATMGGINATGDVRELFQVEDAVNAQLAQALPGSVNPGMYNANNSIYTGAPAPDQNAYQVPTADGSAGATYYYPDYSPTTPYTYDNGYDYGYGPYYYGYPYGLYGGGVFFYGGGYRYYRHGYPYWHGNYHAPVYHGPAHLGGGFHAGVGFHSAGAGGGFHGGGGGGHR